MRVSLGRTNNKKQPSPPPLFVSTSRGPAGVPLKPCVSQFSMLFFFFTSSSFPSPCHLSCRKLYHSLPVPSKQQRFASLRSAHLRNAVQRYFVPGMVLGVEDQMRFIPGCYLGPCRS